MRKTLGIPLALLMVITAVFACCMQTETLASFIKKSAAHDCCKKNQPSAHQHTACDCHHQISLPASQMSFVQLVQNLVVPLEHFEFTWVHAPRIHLASAAEHWQDGPPNVVYQTPLYYQFSTLRL